MKAAGYDFNYSYVKCALPDNVVSADCYVPRDDWDRLGQKIENWLRKLRNSN